MYRCIQSVPLLIQQQLLMEKKEKKGRGAFIQVFTSLAEAHNRLDDRIGQLRWFSLETWESTEHPSWPKLKPFVMTLDMTNEICICITILDSSQGLRDLLITKGGLSASELEAPYINWTHSRV